MDPRDSEHKVFVVDDDEAVGDSLAMLMRSAGIEAETFSSAAAFLKTCRPDQAGCLVLDIRMPGMSGLDLQDELLRRRITLPIIFLTGHGDVPMAVRALKKGAVDFIEKPLEAERLVLAVLNALRGDDERRRQASRHGEPSHALADRLATLSEREREVLELILDGQPTRQIAEQLHLSVKTIEFHRAHIREKLGVSTQAQLFSLFIAAETDYPRNGD